MKMVSGRDCAERPESLEMEMPERESLLGVPGP